MIFDQEETLTYSFYGCNSTITNKVFFKFHCSRLCWVPSLVSIFKMFSRSGGKKLYLWLQLCSNHSLLSMVCVNCDFSWQGTRLAVDIKPTFNFVFLSHLLPVPMTTDLLVFRFTREYH